MEHEIDTSGHDIVETLEGNRRRRAEAAQAKALGERDRMLLPLSVALARLTARCNVREAA